MSRRPHISSLGKQGAYIHDSLYKRLFPAISYYIVIKSVHLSMSICVARVSALGGQSQNVNVRGVLGRVSVVRGWTILTCREASTGLSQVLRMFVLVLDPPATKHFSVRLDASCRQNASVTEDGNIVPVFRCRHEL